MRALRDVEGKCRIRITARNFEKIGNIEPPSNLIKVEAASVEKEDAATKRFEADCPLALTTTVNDATLGASTIDMQGAIPTFARPEKSEKDAKDARNSTTMRVSSRGNDGLREDNADRNAKARRIAKEEPVDQDSLPRSLRPPRMSHISLLSSDEEQDDAAVESNRQSQSPAMITGRNVSSMEQCTIPRSPENKEIVRRHGNSHPRAGFYGDMTQREEIDSLPYLGRDMCLPYALSHLYPGNAELSELLHTTSGPYTLEMMQRSLRFRFYSVCEGVLPSGNYVSIFPSGGVFHCAGIRVENGAYSWYDSDERYRYECSAQDAPISMIWGIARVSNFPDPCGSEYPEMNIALRGISRREASGSLVPLPTSSGENPSAAGRHTKRPIPESS